MEGSRWDFSIADLPESEWARYSLLVPRLVEPHPNRGFSRPINWAEAIAICLQADVRAWLGSAEAHATVPDIEGSRQSDEWGWRFASAIYSWIYDADIALLQTLEMTGSSAANRVAHGVALSFGLLDQDRVQEAEKVLSGLSVDSEHSADQGWLSIHRARILVESGRASEGKAAIENANVQLASVPRDVTVSALRSAAATTLFEITDFRQQEIAAVVPAMDTVASWWRTQSIAYGLERAATRTFRKWSNDSSVTLGAADVPHNELFSAALVARLSGSHGQWRSSTSLMAIVDLSTSRPEKHGAHTALDALRASGDHANLALAIEKVKGADPLEELEILVNGIAPQLITRTSSQADLVCLEHAGAFASADNAMAWIDFLLDCFADPEHFESRYSAKYSVQPAILNALSGLIGHATNAQQNRFVVQLCELPNQPRQILEAPLRRLIARVSDEVIGQSQQTIASRAISSDLSPWYRWQLLGMVGAVDPSARAVIHEGLMGGQFEALVALRRVDAMTPEEAAQMISACEVGIRSYHAEGLTSGLSVGGPDWALLFVQIGAHFSALANWSIIGAFLADNRVLPGRKRSAVKYVSELVIKLPSDFVDELETIALTMQNAVDPKPRVTYSLPLIGGAFHELFLEIAGEGHKAFLDVFSNMLGGDEVCRMDAADYLSRHETHDLLLIGLTGDENYRVSHRAMLCVARRVATSPTPSSLFVSRITEFLAKDGEANADFILGGLQGTDGLPPELGTIVEELEHHASADIRQLATRLSQS